MDWPDGIRVRQKFPTQAVTDVASEVSSQFEKEDLRNRARGGASVAVGCSSRGIANYNIIVKATQIRNHLGAYHAHESTPLRAKIGHLAVGRQVEAVDSASVFGHERVVGNPRHRLTAPFYRT